MPTTNDSQLWAVLMELTKSFGEMRGDIKWLVDERKSSSRRIDDVEEKFAEEVKTLRKDIDVLKNWKIRVGVFTGILGVGGPILMTILFNILGLG